MVSLRNAALLLLLAFQGCGDSEPSGSASVAAPATPILTPFQGKWRFSLPKTMARWKADGMPPAKIAQAQKLAATFPPHPDMSLAGTTALLDGVVEGSYDFFALHQHPSWVCGKAWHHEDRHDPGDMDKYFIRLQLVQSDLHLSVRVPDGAADPTDPDVTSMPLLDGSATSCPADAAKSPPWSAWQTFVFEPDN